MIVFVLIFIGGVAFGTFVTWWTLCVEPKDSCGPGIPPRRRWEDAPPWVKRGCSPPSVPSSPPAPPSPED